jgi:agmatinase
MRLPHVTDLAGVDFAVVGVPFDTATSFRAGARNGPEAIRSVSALLRPYHRVHDIDIFSVLSGVDLGDLPVVPGNVQATYERIEEGLAPLVKRGVFPLVLGGDHSITLAELRALAGRHGPLALVQLDAHDDTWDAYFGERYFHGTTFRRAAEEGVVDPQRSTQAGMRGPLYGAADVEHGAELGFCVVAAEELRALGPKSFAAEVRERASGAPVFFSFDVDFPRPRLRSRDGHARGGRLHDGGGARVHPSPDGSRRRWLRLRRGRAGVRRPGSCDCPGGGEHRLGGDRPAGARRPDDSARTATDVGRAAS